MQEQRRVVGADGGERQRGFAVRVQPRLDRLFGPVGVIGERFGQGERQRGQVRAGGDQEDQRVPVGAALSRPVGPVADLGRVSRYW